MISTGSFEHGYICWLESTVLGYTDRRFQVLESSQSRGEVPAALSIIHSHKENHLASPSLGFLGQLGWFTGDSRCYSIHGKLRRSDLICSVKFRNRSSSKEIRVGCKVLTSPKSSMGRIWARHEKSDL